MNFKVRNFEYNGFFVIPKRGEASYSAEFESWTNDPGIAVFKCSDGQDRKIPSCCLIGDTQNLPIQNMENKVMFGEPSVS